MNKRVNEVGSAMTIIQISDINQTKRPMLAKKMRSLSHITIYALNFEIPSKRDINGSITCLYQNRLKKTWIIMQDVLEHGFEKLTELQLNPDEAKAFSEIVNPRPDIKIGRPKKYGLDTARKIKQLQNEKMSIREIAKKLQISTATIQKLLKEYSTYL